MMTLSAQRKIEWKSGYLLPLILLALLLMMTSAHAEQLFLKHGQSRTLTVKGHIDTVFISNPGVADYKIVGDNSLVLFAKSTGLSELTVYGKDARVLLKTSVGVDPLLADLNARIKSEYPGADVIVKRFIGGSGGDKASYILTGVAPDEESRDEVYALVAALVGVGDSQTETLKSDDSANFMRRKTYDNLINRIQLPSTNQVNVKLTVVEVSKEFTDTLGIEWRSLTLDSIIGGGSGVSPVGSFNLIGFKGGFDSKNISMLINAVQNDSIARVLAQPNLSVLSGEKAEFLVGGEVPILTRQDDTTTVTYKEYGIKLAIAAKVEKKSKIKLFVSNELSSISGSYALNEYNVPMLTTRRSHSTIELADGDSFVIGGLLSEADRENLTKIPFIGDIPILGALARNASTERKKTELVVFATVNLVRPSSSVQQIDIPHFRKTRTGRLLVNVGVDSEVREQRLTNDTSSFLSQGGFAK